MRLTRDATLVVGLGILRVKLDGPGVVNGRTLGVALRLANIASVPEGPGQVRIEYNCFVEIRARALHVSSSPPHAAATVVGLGVVRLDLNRLGEVGNCAVDMAGPHFHESRVLQIHGRGVDRRRAVAAG